ncbi:MAG: hypothetical protein AAGA02_15000 [Bacteroidota bacterium]
MISGLRPILNILLVAITLTGGLTTQLGDKVPYRSDIELLGSAEAYKSAEYPNYFSLLAGESGQYHVWFDNSQYHALERYHNQLVELSLKTTLHRLQKTEPFKGFNYLAYVQKPVDLYAALS